MESEVESKSRICPVPPGSKMGLIQRLKPRTIFMAVGLVFMLTTTGLAYYLMQPTLIVIPIPPPTPSPDPGTPHGPLVIDGDANFSDTALLEGWPGDGSPGNPYVIEGLDIDLAGGEGYCISINNTRVSFIIRNCNITGANFVWGVEMGEFFMRGSGIRLFEVANGEIVNNTCNNNGMGIRLSDSSNNTVANNTCNNNVVGICLEDSDSNTVATNTCNNNAHGIFCGEDSDSNTVENNTCTSNAWNGIILSYSDSNTVANNMCNNNNMNGINLWRSSSNTVANNMCNSNTDYGIILEDSHSNTLIHNICNNNGIDIYPIRYDQDYVTAGFLLIGLITITFLGAGWGLAKLSRVESKGE